MKRLIFLLTLSCGCLFVSGQQKMTPEYARKVTANTMANFTESVSFAYVKGVTFEGFRKTLCGSATPLDQGNYMIKQAYTYLSKGVTKERIMLEDNGRAVAGAMQLFLNQHNKGINYEGSEIFGEKSVLEKTSSSREGCRWYQFWCHVQAVILWVAIEWGLIPEIIIWVGLP